MSSLSTARMGHPVHLYETSAGSRTLRTDSHGANLDIASLTGLMRALDGCGKAGAKQGPVRGCWRTRRPVTAVTSSRGRSRRWLWQSGGKAVMRTAILRPSAAAYWT